MEALNFPSFDFRFKNNENSIQIFDIIRKKFILLQPEEWVRQHVIHYLIFHKKYPKSLINVEKQLTINGNKRRYDIAIYHPDGSLNLLVECKSYNVTINQHVFDQIARYNLQLRSKYLMVTNGLEHYYCKMDFQKEKYSFLPNIPDFSR